MGSRIGSLRTIFTREQWFSFQHLRKYASGTPDVDRNIVLLPGQHDFWSTIVTRRDVSGHLRILDAGETEITDLARFRIKLVAVIRSNTLRSQFSLMRILLGFCDDPLLSASVRWGVNLHPRDRGARRQQSARISNLSASQLRGGQAWSTEQRTRIWYRKYWMNCFSRGREVSNR